MMQENINKAFSRLPRITNNATNYMQNKIYLLNGKNTGKLGVISIKGPNKEKIFLTDIERTLIDIAIRPQYSGGVSNVLNVYRKVIQNISAEKILKMLTKLKYLYPYHQTIGFYLDKAGLEKDSIIFREKIRIEYDFYLTYQIDQPEYCEKWRIFYPKSLFVTPAK
jgi:predicted transcriptional regulator of viral defense system